MGITEIASIVNKKLKLNDVIMVRKILNEGMAQVKKNVYKGKKVSIPGILTIYLEIRPPKEYNDLQNPGEKIQKPATWFPKIKYHRSFQEEIKEKPCYYEGKD